LQTFSGARMGVGMSEHENPRPITRATQRPGSFTKPAHWTNEPLPAPATVKGDADPAGLSPTRYGDWVRDGIAVDF
jgi:hypothetical protein